MPTPVQAIKAAILQKPTPSNLEAYLLDLDRRVSNLESQRESLSDEEEIAAHTAYNTNGSKQVLRIDVYDSGEFLRTRFVNLKKIEEAIGGPL